MKERKGERKRKRLQINKEKKRNFQNNKYRKNATVSTKNE